MPFPAKRGQHGFGRELGEVLDRFTHFAGAENQRDRRFFTPLTLVAIEPPQIELHLPCVSRFEVTER